MNLNFFKFKLPSASGPCPDSSFSILLCKGIVKDFFQILDAGRCSPVAGRKTIESAGRRSPRHHRCRCRGRPKGGPLWESPEMHCIEIVIRSPQNHATWTKKSRGSWLVVRGS